jgi:hypothetical protein
MELLGHSPLEDGATGRSTAQEQTSRLTVFTFLWACQALVHHEFYSSWLWLDDWAGWLVAVFAVAVLLRPKSLPLFAAMLASSVVYNVRKWPFVVNHILVESLIDLTILAAMGAWLYARRPRRDPVEFADRERIYDRFAPVLRAMLVLMYAFAFLSKLNRDFLDPHLSCVSVMYQNVLRRFPLVPDADWSRLAAIGATLVVEAAIPLLFLFRRTRPWAVAIGLPFHFVLGSIGHRTFSAIAYALYGLFLIDALAPLIDDWRDVVVRRFGAMRLRRGLPLAHLTAAGGIAALIVAARTGHYHAGVGPLQVYRIPWAMWGLWSLALGAAYLVAMARLNRLPLNAPDPASLRWLHPAVFLVALNGLCPYLGIKSETSFTMYSNLRTEAGLPNHLFLPSLRLAHYQDDLVDIVATDSPELQQYIDRNQWMTWFEFRRFTSTHPRNFWVRYKRNGGGEAEFSKRNGEGSDAALMAPHPLWAAKLLYFRPVSKEACVPCAH